MEPKFLEAKNGVLEMRIVEVWDVIGFWTGIYRAVSDASLRKRWFHWGIKSYGMKCGSGQEWSWETPNDNDT